MIHKLKEWVFRKIAARSIRKYGGERVAPASIKTKPEEWRVAFLTTAGVHLKSDKPFDVDAGDWSVRLLPADAETSKLTVTHTHYDTKAAEEDINTVFPIDALRSLALEGVIKEVSPTNFGMMGYIPRTDKLLKESVPEIMKTLRQDKPDVVLLSPG
ncbi:glycine/sarcosine/betaine reductase selenoprotein B family protein [Bacillus daqingensis]|uniref:Glycine/sarcosine/betaine reductase selenoprotein B family protein n=1 Tax=Bacillus daqingensis TaxID=872396 RepID=A0ABV9NZ42_9BACI